MKLFRRLFAVSPDRHAAFRIYNLAVARARTPFFYQRLAVPDTLDGRFDLIVYHVYLLLRRLRVVPQSKGLQICLQEALFADMDRALREMGVGDLSVGKHIRRMAEAFRGRVSAYDGAISDWMETRSKDEIEAAIVRNIYRGDEAAGKSSAVLVQDMCTQVVWLDELSDDQFLSDDLVFAPHPAETAEQAS